jgi:hypothetical protein
MKDAVFAIEDTFLRRDTAIYTDNWASLEYRSTCKYCHLANSDDTETLLNDARRSRSSRVMRSKTFISSEPVYQRSKVTITPQKRDGMRPRENTARRQIESFEARSCQLVTTINVNTPIRTPLTCEGETTE